MVWPFKKKKKVIDLTEYYSQNELPSESYSMEKGTGSPNIVAQSSSSSNNGPFGNFFGNANESRNEQREEPLSLEERKQRFVNRFAQMTERIEDLSNQIYRLQQRVELLEKKLERSG